MWLINAVAEIHTHNLQLQVKRPFPLHQPVVARSRKYNFDVIMLWSFQGSKALDQHICQSRGTVRKYKVQ